MGIGFKELLVILVVVLLVFGAKRLRNVGSDLGEAVKGFRKAMNDDANDKEPNNTTQQNNDDKTP